jgi:hypothetical protein
VLAYSTQFDRIWNEALTIEERKDYLRCFVHQINISHSPTDVRAEIWLYKIPLPAKNMTPETADLNPLISRVNCGGRHSPQVKGVPPEILPFVLRKLISLKRPYDHYRANVA